VLDVSSCRRVSDDGVRAVLARCTALHSLRVQVGAAHRCLSEGGVLGATRGDTGRGPGTYGTNGSKGNTRRKGTKRTKVTKVTKGTKVRVLRGLTQGWCVQSNHSLSSAFADGIARSSSLVHLDLQRQCRGQLHRTCTRAHTHTQPTALSVCTYDMYVKATMHADRQAETDSPMDVQANGRAGRSIGRYMVRWTDRWMGG
jgi:hypothetical protein